MIDWGEIPENHIYIEIHLAPDIRLRKAVIIFMNLQQSTHIRFDE